MICLSLCSPSIAGCLEEASSGKAYCDLYELRMDCLDKDEALKAKDFPSLVDKPVILTFRREKDGGRRRTTEKERRSELLLALDGSFSYVDIEGDLKKGAVEKKAREKGVEIIRSMHDYEGVPSDIFLIAESLLEKGDIAKIAVTPHSVSDLLILFDMKNQFPSSRMIIVGMGEWGKATRILYKRTGSILTYSSSGSALAPGMLSARELKEGYLSDKVTEDTAIYGVVGNPVSQSLSPLIHNPAFKAIRYNAVYVPFLAESIGAFMPLAEKLKMRGFSVTVPFKNEVLSYLGNISREVKLIGSCNTVVRVPGMWKGINTDYFGFLRPIEGEISSGKIRSAIVIGAGGAAQAIVWALRSKGVKVLVLNRTLSSALRLAERFGASADSLSSARKYEGRADLIVQTTTVGMGENEGKNPIEGFSFSGKEIAYDIVSKPQMTAFLLAAKKAGCSLRYGREMLMEQGKLQFEAFTGYYYPQGLDPLGLKTMHTEEEA